MADVFILLIKEYSDTGTCYMSLFLTMEELLSKTTAIATKVFQLNKNQREGDEEDEEDEGDEEDEEDEEDDDDFDIDVRIYIIKRKMGLDFNVNILPCVLNPDEDNGPFMGNDLSDAEYIFRGDIFEFRKQFSVGYVHE